ncbi:MAG: response regulator transcription factor [Treponema sp.]|nr:response regulator transcription factor [Treponema sp.]
MIKVVTIGQSEVTDQIAPVLSSHSNFQILAHGKDAYDALKLVSTLKPDIIMMDSNLAFIDGEDIPPLLRSRSPTTSTVIIADSMNDNQLHHIISNNVSGLVHSEADIDLLPWVLKSISDGGCFISPSFTPRILQLMTIMNLNNFPYAPNNALPEKAPFSSEDPARYLSKTDLQILTHIAEGNTSEEIANSLNITTGTVRNYISAVMQKTGLRNRSQMVLFALKHGLVPLSIP